MKREDGSTALRMPKFRITEETKRVEADEIAGAFLRSLVALILLAHFTASPPHMPGCSEAGSQTRHRLDIWYLSTLEIWTGAATQRCGNFVGNSRLETTQKTG